MLIEGDRFAEREFRRGAWHQTLTTVAMVTATDGDRQNVMACEWAMLLTTNPMRFVISVGSQHATHGLIQQSGEFGLNFCSDRQAMLSHVSGSYSLNDIDKWELASFPTYPAKKIQAPMIEGCTLNAECHVISAQTLGGYTAFIGEALWARYDPELKPLLYHRGQYFFVGERVPKEPMSPG
jgi:flavin reductase (DIM6/NTAB) family NADH-FMN oxidoreductase RutF